MSAVDDGGPAFPVHETPDSTDNAGMTLRDYFAAKAMQSMVVGPNVICRHGEGPQDAVARLAYTMADAMLKARKEQQ